MVNSIDNSDSRGSSIKSKTSNNQQDLQSNASGGKWQDKNVKPMSTTPSIIKDASDLPTTADPTPAKKENHNSFITWLNGIKVKKKKKFEKELDALSTKERKKLQALKKSDLSKEVDIPLKASIDSTPIIRDISEYSLMAMGAMLLLIPFIALITSNIYFLIPVLVILSVAIALVALVDHPKDYNDYTTIINLDQKSVRVGITNMLHAIFNEMDIDKDYTMEHEALKKKIKQIINDGTAFQKLNKLNNNIKTVSNYDNAELLDELTKGREQRKIKNQIQIIFSSLFSEIETEIQDEKFYASFLKAKKKYFTSLVEKGFESKEHFEFNYLFLHNLGKTIKLDYRRDNINPIVQAGIKDGIQATLKSISRMK
jgi:hypothetical protein